MKIMVIGATGRTGRHLLEDGVRHGHAITAFARRPEALADVPGLTAVIAGDGLNLDDVRRAVRGQDAVIVGVGDAAIVRNAITAMREAGVRRLVCVSAYPVGSKNPRLLVEIARLIFREVYTGLARMEAEVVASDLDWTIVRPTRLTNGSGTGHPRRERDGHDFTAGPFSIRRADLARALLESVERTDDVRAAVAVTGARGR
jgi:putative NADH-flavin reductase